MLPFRAHFSNRASAWLVPAAIVVASFLIRFVYLDELRSMPTFDHPVMDEAYHVELAQRINSPSGYGAEPYFRAPLYPYFFALLYRLTGRSLYWSRFLQIILGSLLPLLIYYLARKLFDKRIAIWAAVIAVIYPTFIYHDATILITFLKTILAVILIWQLYRCQERPTIQQFALAGLVLGLAGIARPNFLVFGPALAVWAWLIIKPKLGLKKTALRYFIMGACTVAVIAPVTIRNYVVSGGFVPIAWQGGFNFFLGNSRASNGWSAAVPGIDQSWEGGYKESIAIAEKASGRKLTKNEISDYWYRQGENEIAASPEHFVSLLVKKVRLFVNGYEIPNNEDMYVVRRFAPVMRPLMFAGIIYFPYGIIAPLALIGLALSLRQWRKFLIVYLFIAAYAGSFLLFFVCSRYREPLVPLAIMFAVYAVYRIIQMARKRETKNLAIGGIAFVLLLVESNHNILGLRQNRTDAENDTRFGTVYLDTGDLKRAQTWFDSAIKADSTFASAYVNLAIVHARRYQWEDAGRCFQEALKFEPGNTDTYINYATMLLNRRDRQGAVELLEKARQMDSMNSVVHLKLALAYFDLERYDDARREAETTLQLDPSDNTARLLLAQIARRHSLP